MYSINAMEQSSEPKKKRRWLRPLLRVILALFFVVAGVAHFRRPFLYVQIVPSYLPFPLWLVYVSGAAEILGGIGLLIAPLRRAAGWGLIVLLVAVFPANVHMALGDVRIQELPVAPTLLWLRLPLQGVFIVWVWWCMLED